jgi:replicative DNA helicase
MERFGDACGAVHHTTKNIILDDRKGMSTKDIVAAARMMITRHQVKALFVDHLGEIHVARSDRYDLDLSECLRDLRALADMYRVPLVLFCHLKRRQGLERTDTPELTDFANTSGLERMARLAIGLSQRYDGNGAPEALGVHVLKQTQGIPNVSTWLRFNGPSAMATNEEAP